MSGDLLRIIDANLNRIGEGLRVLEDIARMLLNDTELSQRLKDMRHNIVNIGWTTQQQCLQARDAEGDVGIDLEVTGEEKYKELPEAVVANSRRVQEALRVMEELAKTPGLDLDSEKFKQARFGLYTIEKTLISRLLRQDKARRIKGLYVIVDTQALGGRSHVEVARQAIQGGAAVIQLRDKVHSKRELLPIARQLQDLCARHGVLFIVNDYLDVALAIEADGVHLGQDDLPVAVARQLLPVDKILGCSVTTAAQATAAQIDGADYLGVCAIYPTPSKEAVVIIGLDGLRQIGGMVSLPLVALGGIIKENMADVMAAGADAVAVISAVLGAEDVAGACRELVDTLEIKK